MIKITAAMILDGIIDTIYEEGNSWKLVSHKILSAKLVDEDSKFIMVVVKDRGTVFIEKGSAIVTYKNTTFYLNPFDYLDVKKSRNQSAIENAEKNLLSLNADKIRIEAEYQNIQTTNEIISYRLSLRKRIHLYFKNIHNVGVTGEDLKKVFSVKEIDDMFSLKFVYMDEYKIHLTYK